MAVRATAGPQCRRAERRGQGLVRIDPPVVGKLRKLSKFLAGPVLAPTAIAGRYVDDRFERGDQIKVGDYEGTITEIGLASTEVELDGGGAVEIPHSYLLSRPVMRRAGDQIAAERAEEHSGSEQAGPSDGQHSAGADDDEDTARD